ncbi:unnamed protein product [Bursaphelenchus okinawaensis]|uniref:Serine/threonine specific protein phosphatases domain-containing protein n=1 Tax=Bursaphelenchus okinawaensis TaxID=465554 RepID=A0A811L5M0_9BILA|nr:unnamed protein product [Bursaphelenchus okinawaensis]CAG9119904.1 unnamed protein product [Bursaphelenchus okinawaensis]
MAADASVAQSSGESKRKIPVFEHHGPVDEKKEDEVDQLIRSIWAFIYGYSESAPMAFPTSTVLKILIRAEEILMAENSVVDLDGTVIIFGDLQGQADSLLSLISLVEMPPQNVFLFLGNYIGQGFGPHECLFLLLALKIKYPNHIYILKGGLEDPFAMKAHEFIEGMYLRGLFKTSMVWQRIVNVVNQLPIAAVISNKYFCVHGGIGPQLLKRGIHGLRKHRKPARSSLDFAMEQECVWGAFRPNSDRFNRFKDGSPVFGEREIQKFLKANGFRMMIRSRQVVFDGILQYPAEMITVWSAAAFLDNFRNMGAILILDSVNHRAIISRIRVMEDEPKSLDDMKPQAGRNAIAIN